MPSDNQLTDANNADHNITANTIYNANTFNGAMRSFAMYANLILTKTA